MKKIINTLSVLLLLFSIVFSVNAQVKVGNTTGEAHEGSLLHLGSNGGLLLSEVELSDTKIYGLTGDSNDAVGMLVYNKNESVINGDGKGVYIWDGTQWLKAGKILVADITFPEDNPTSVDLDEKITLHAEVQPDNANDKTVIWSIVSGGATIDSSTGELAGTAVGKVIVKAEAADGSGASKTFNITVRPLEPTADSPQTFCGNGTVANLLAIGSDLKWYNDATTGTKLESSSVLNSGTYYVSQTVNEVESKRKPVTVTVSPISVGGSISGSATVCSSNNSTALTLSGHIGNIVKWQLSTNGTTWTDIIHTAASYIATNLTTTTHYRAIVQNGSCSTTNSSTATVTVAANFTQSNPPSVTINSGSTTTLILAEATGGLGDLTYQWQQSTNNSVWTNISGAISANYTTPTLTNKMYYRRQATRSICGGTIISNSALVTVETCGSNGEPGTVTGARGTYLTHLYNTGTNNAPQCWMVSNSMEGNYSARGYENGTSRVNGYYYTWSQASSACPSGWHIPTNAEWTKMGSIVWSERTSFRTTPWWTKISYNAFAGRYHSGTGWRSWNVETAYWTSSYMNYVVNGPGDGSQTPFISSPINEYGDGDYYPVRCVRN